MAFIFFTGIEFSELSISKFSPYLLTKFKSNTIYFQNITKMLLKKAVLSTISSDNPITNSSKENDWNKSYRLLMSLADVFFMPLNSFN